MVKNNDKIKLLILMPSMVGGGAERILINLLNNIDFKKFKVDLYVFDKKGELWNSIPSKVHKKHIYLPQILNKIGQVLYRKYGFGLLLNYYGLRIRGDYDVGVSYLDTMYTHLLKGYKCKVDKKITAIHSSYRSYSNRSKFITGRHKKRMLNRYNKMDEIICVSYEVEQEFNSFFNQNNKTKVIYNPINSKDIIEKSFNSKINLDSFDVFNFTAIGSLIPVKGFDLLIEAIHLLKNEELDFKLNIIGDGHLKKNLTVLIEEYDLQEYVKLWGFQENPYGILKQSDALVISSKTEGLPTVMCEAMILGKPCIVPNISGCREVSNNGEFALQVERTKEDLYMAMKKMIQDPKTVNYFKKQSRIRCEIFDDKVALEKYFKLFAR